MHIHNYVCTYISVAKIISYYINQKPVLRIFVSVKKSGFV